MEFKRKIAAVAMSALLFSSFATPAFAATTIQITGNGTSSNNDATVTTTNTTTVVQNNEANISNKVNVDADTGNNTAKDNTGGDVTVKTGDAQTKVDVSTTVNKNTASVDCCPTGNTEVVISGNGSKSDNNAELDQSRQTNVFQSNNADIKNKVDVDANTGKNDAKDNTGGDVTVKTGDAQTKVDVSNSGNVNSAKVGNGSGGGSVSVMITGNGTNSDNDVKLGLNSDTTLAQSNNADINNKVDVDANTGKNDAKDNTGGDVTIETGDAKAKVGIDNMVNFNTADVDCGCLLSDLLAKVSGNGSDSDNTITADLGTTLEAFQSNCGENLGPVESDGHYKKCGTDNNVDVNGNTGKNDAKDNTGPAGNDPVEVTTGDANADTSIGNSGNVNVFGKGGALELPDFSFDLHISHHDLSNLLSALLGLLG